MIWSAAVLCALVLVAGACGGSEGPEIVFDSRPPQTDLSSSRTTVDRAPLAWVDVTGNLAGQPSECGNLGYVAAEPDSDVVIAGVALHGLWANAVGTDQWIQLGGPAQPIQNRTSSIVFDPEAPETFWQSGAYLGPGVFRTTDGGQSFEVLGDVENLDGLSVDLSDPERQTMLVGSHERGDLFRSTDGGNTWDNLAANLPPGLGYASQPLVLSRDVHLLGTYTGMAPGIFRTTDGGTNWAQVHPTGVAGLPLVTSSDPNTILWPLSNGGVARSTDGGENWDEAAPAGTLSSYNIVELSDGSLASLNGTSVVVSSRGTRWRELGPALPPFAQDAGWKGLAYSPERDAIFVWQNDCNTVVLPGAVQRLDLSPEPG
jgi:photosystem II stability/assembly factor-like uncharacterized protein